MDKHIVIFATGIAAVTTILVIFFLQQQVQDLLMLQKMQVYDRFGILELFPTKPGGREWFMNLENPHTDNVFEVSNGHKLVRRPDGSWYGEGVPPDHRTRIMIKSPVGYEPWMDVEMTGYFKVERTFGHEIGKSDAQNTFQAYARGGIHSNQLMQGSDGKYRYLNCVGSAYKGRIYFDGAVNVAKEIGHSVYAPPRYTKGEEDRSWESYGKDQFMPLVQDYNAADGHFYGGRWVGLKVVIYTIDSTADTFDSGSQQKVRILIYIDEQAENKNGDLQPSNNWRLLADVIDAGRWGVEYHHVNNATAEVTNSDEVNEIDNVTELIDRCGNPFGTTEEYATMVITWPGHPAFIGDPTYRPISNTASFRWDYTGATFTYLSVREIDSFSE